MDEQKAKDKVLVKARSWAASRKAKLLAAGSERERQATGRHRANERELAEAVESLEKGWASSGAAPAKPSEST